MNLIEKRLVNRLVKRSLNEANSNSLLDAIELLVDAYKNIDTTIKGNKKLEYDLSVSLIGIKNAIRIIRGNLYNS